MRSSAEIPLSLAGYEKACLERALREVGGDVTKIPALLGHHPSTIYRKLALHGLAGVQICEHGRARKSARSPAIGSDELEHCSACNSGIKLPIENRYR